MSIQPRKPRGFAAMDPTKQKEIAPKGGKAAHASGHAHQFDATEARAAGQLGGAAVAQDREHMRQIDRKGGHASKGRAVTPANSAPQG